MTKMKRNVSILAVASVLAVAGNVTAAPAVSSLSASVNNAINITVETPMSFGIIRATQDDTESSSFVLNPETSESSAVTNTDNTKATMNIIAPGVPADIKITGAVPNTNLNVSLPTTVNMTGVGDANPTFAMSSFTAFYYNADFNVNAPRTTNAGELFFRVGATLSSLTDAGAAAGLVPIADNVYSGDVSITVEY